MSVKNSIKRILYYFGYEIRRIPGDLGQNRISTDLGQDPFQDMRKLAASPFRPVIFDVGANVGQSVNLFCRHFDQLIIHAFEPSLDTFRELQQQTAGVPDLHLNNFALGSRIESRVLIENVHSDMSSFLEPSVESWGKVKERRQVEVRTLDDYCAEQGLTHIDVLKLDSQGFDLEAIRGSQELIEQQGIHLLYMEMTFSDMYKGLPRSDEIYRLLSDHGFFLVSFYSFYYQHDRASWTDALFVNPEYQQSNNGLR